MAWHGLPGRKLYYEDSGRGDAVALMPGWGGSIADLSRLRHDLAGGFRVVVVDLPGSGRSQPQPRHYTPGYYREDATVLLGLLDALGIGAARLAGFSDGGEEALLMAALRPGCALSLFTWGAIGQIVASRADLDEVAAAITHGQFVEAHGAGHDIRISHGTGFQPRRSAGWPRTSEDPASSGR
jgi:valacyclovir hydrolase